LSTTIRVQASWINDSEFIGYFVAMARGYYGAAGLSVEHFPGSAGLMPQRKLLSGDADIALTSPDSLATTVRATGRKFRIIGAQFQKNPLGLVSLASEPLNGLRDLKGRIAVLDINRRMVVDLIAASGADINAVTFVPYVHDIMPLANNEIDGFVDFFVDGQYKLRQRGLIPHAILLHDHGAPMFNNVAVVLADDSAPPDPALRQWLAASRRGWEENARDLTIYPRELRGHWMDTSRTLEHETFANQMFAPLVASPHGIFSMTDADIEACRRYLETLGLPLDRDVFDQSLLEP
jgi:hypothetical protein